MRKHTGYIIFHKITMIKFHTSGQLMVMINEDQIKNIYSFIK